MSKAALNMLTRKLAMELVQQSITVVAVHPGSVRTRLGGPAATPDVETAVSGVLDVITRLGAGASGRLAWADAAEIIPW